MLLSSLAVILPPYIVQIYIPYKIFSIRSRVCTNGFSIIIFNR